MDSVFQSVILVSEASIALEALDHMKLRETFGMVVLHTIKCQISIVERRRYCKGLRLVLVGGK